MYVAAARIGDRGYSTNPRLRKYGRDGGYFTSANCHSRRDTPFRVRRVMVLDIFIDFLRWALIWNVM